ncbi:hypothetical protein QIA34_00235 (plasmid) [Borreliella yangtzensis]|uniref:Uncharacterized protein n=1 Tax=Borreliella yangtzensis TaxID=683292 RepID=A0ABR6PAL3_9SPIR|nr:hypothetical protein [Borreliella yangtzensis]MBB6043317.1 hypothetical protein [Borreliella yangtzensis]MBB6043326.1 hypothetical protein [Borreliella yangtzensis]WKC72940.1 hypothetical protein QIA35_00235 [Borreliella yangtzensis]WKC73860.1 hypothetical protein QIA34_00235 [Borreliella yangtzensis]
MQQKIIKNYNEYAIGGIKETFFGNSQYEANYRAKINGFIIDFFKIPISLKKKYELNIKALSDPNFSSTNIAMNCINTFKLIVDVVNMQTGENYDYDTFITETETEKMLKYGTKIIAALARHFDEKNKTNFNESYYEWEKGWIDKKWIDYEPTEAEIKEIQSMNQKLNPLKLNNEEKTFNKGQIKLLKSINKIKNQSQQHNVKSNSTAKKLKGNRRKEVKI